MPLPDDLRKGLDSPVADLAERRRRSSWGGMLVAGHFLKRLRAGRASRGCIWTSPGPAFNASARRATTRPKGGTGAGVRTMVAAARHASPGG